MFSSSQRAHACTTVLSVSRCVIFCHQGLRPPQRNKPKLTAPPYALINLSPRLPGGVIPYFEKLGYPCPPHSNPADFVIDLVNADFDDGGSEMEGKVVNPTPDQLADQWKVNGNSVSDARFPASGEPQASTVSKPSPFLCFLLRDP